LSSYLGVAARREGEEDKGPVITGVKVGDVWVGRVSTRRGHLSRKILGGKGWLISYEDQGGKIGRCWGVTFQAWVKKWDARPLPAAG
jgi:hypothetical protein